MADVCGKNLSSPKRIVWNAWQLQKSMYTSLLAFGRPLYFPMNQNTTYADLMDGLCLKKNKLWVANQKFTTPVKFGGGSVRMWGCMAVSGVWNFVFIDRHMTAEMYIDILRANLKTNTLN